MPHQAVVLTCYLPTAVTKEGPPRCRMYVARASRTRGVHHAWCSPDGLATSFHSRAWVVSRGSTPLSASSDARLLLQPWQEHRNWAPLVRCARAWPNCVGVARSHTACFVQCSAHATKDLVHVYTELPPALPVLSQWRVHMWSTSAAVCSARARGVLLNDYYPRRCNRSVFRCHMSQVSLFLCSLSTGNDFLVTDG